MLSTWLMAASLSAAPLVQSETKPNNVVLIVLDDVGVDLIGAYERYYVSIGRAAGAPANTPAIDNLLAARGVAFTNVWTCPRCSPSRAQMLTGRYAMHNGIGQIVPEAVNVQRGNQGLSASARLLPEVLHGATPRYECAAVGKWHLAGVNDDGVDRLHALGVPVGRWFDIYAGSLFNLRDPNERARGAPDYSHWLKTYATAIASEDKPCASGSLPCDVPMVVPPLANYATVDTADDAIALAGKLREPWFLYVSFNAAHVPVHDVPEGLPRASCDGYVAPPSRKLGADATTPEKVRRVLEEADAQIARLLCALDASDTAVILIGDNGTSLDAILPPYASAHSKQTLYEGGINVPMIVRWPVARAESVGAFDDALVSSTDVFATVAEIAGIAVSEPDSVSLVPCLRGDRSKLRRTLYVESFAPNFAPDPATGKPPKDYLTASHNQALRDARFKLIRTTSRDGKKGGDLVVEEELFDLLEGGPPDARSDPPRPTRDFFESRDLLKETLAPESAAAKALSALRAELGQRFPSLVH